jgi:putative nucleotidyltransferase with HDIG domain
MCWKIADNKDWGYLSEKFDWVAGMQQTLQDEIYHGEGDVATHTRMVLSCLEQMPEYQALDEQSQEVLWTAALLHDVEKRSTSVVEPDGHVSSHGHARRGEYTARTILFRDIPAPFEIREQIAGLVRYHGLPIWLTERPDAQKKLFEVSQRVNTSLLKLLSVADINGRICNDKAQLLEQVSFFEMYCKEQDCWGKAREFANNHARFHYFNTGNGYPDYVPHDDFKSTVILLSGLPGMGKDHFIKKQYPDWPVISLDDIRRKHKLSPTDKSATGWVVQQAKEQTRVYLRKGESFVWNATNITRLMRQQLIDLFVTYDAYVKIVYIEKPYITWLEQNKNREFPIPQTVLEKMLGKLEIPQIWETHEVEFLVS